jgi:3-oxoacyl-[acyl-carrier protein] reductase
MRGGLLEDRVCVVTGAATGIGRTIVEVFCSAGAGVYGIDRDRAIADTIEQVRHGGGAAWGFEADVRDAEALRVAVDSAMDRFGRIDVLVNNAGIYPRRAFLDMTEAEWDEVMDVNLKGVFYCTKLVLPHMAARGAGKIVNISSVNVFRGGARLSHYTAAKSGVVGLTRSLSREAGPLGVHVNCVTPGAVETDMEKVVAKPEEIAELVAQQSLRRRITTLDIARVCLFLASELSDGLTGQTINVDGGRILH